MSDHVCKGCAAGTFASRVQSRRLQHAGSPTCAASAMGGRQWPQKPSRLQFEWQRAARMEREDSTQSRCVSVFFISVLCCLVIPCTCTGLPARLQGRRYRRFLLALRNWHVPRWHLLCWPVDAGSCNATCGTNMHTGAHAHQHMCYRCPALSRRLPDGSLPKNCESVQLPSFAVRSWAFLPCDVRSLQRWGPTAGHCGAAQHTWLRSMRVLCSVSEVVQTVILVHK